MQGAAVQKQPVVWRRRRGQSRLLLSAAVVLAALGVLAKATDLAEGWRVPPWALFVVAALAGVGAVLLQRAQETAKARDERDDVVARASLGALDGQLGRVRDAALQQ